MDLPVATSLFAYSLTIVCACILARRSSNWRIRLLAFTIALLPLCQGTILLGEQRLWVSAAMGQAAESMELLVSALCLTAVHLLNKENRDRKETDVQLRIFEP